MRGKKRYNFILTFLVMLFLAFPVNVEAASKDVVVTIASASKSASFTIQFAKGNDYTISVISPEGESHDAEKVSNDYYKCDVNNLSAGDWKVHIELDGDGEIETANVTVKRQKATETVVDNQIRVGKDIADLKMYFVDRTFNVEWEDETVGNVNVKIVNLDNGEVLANEAVKSMSYSLDLEDTVKKIQVTIVPSTSASVSGAEQTFTFDVNSEINGSVSFEEANVTNQAVMPVHININQSYSFYATDNDVKIYEDGLKDAGEYDVELKISDDGEHNLIFYLIDENGNMYSTSKTVVKDTVPPVVTLSKDYNNIKTYDTVVPIEGTVINFETLTINGENVPVTTDGSFSQDVTLHVGDNTIDIMATDDAGNEAGYSCNIQVLEKKKPNFIPFIIGGIAALLLIVGFIFRNRIMEFLSKPKQSKKLNAFETASEKRKVKVNKENSNINTVKIINFFLKYVVYVIACIVLFFGLIHLGVCTSGSMENTIKVGDISIGNRLAYIKYSPEREDIISFKHNGESYCKRIIGIEGDKIEFFDGYVYINGEQYDEAAYIDEDIETNSARTFEVPKGYVFVLGDNRENSLDSRYWEEPYVSIDDITSKRLFSIPTHVIYEIFK